MNLPLSSAFTESHRFWVVVFSFSLISMHILISFLIFSVICWLFRSMLFSLNMFVFLIVFFPCSWHLILPHCDQKRCLFSSVQSLSHVRLFVTPRTAACQASLSNTNSWSPPKLMSIEWVMLSNHLILCRPLLLLPSIFPSIRVFSSESGLCIRWPKDWSFSFSISPSNKYSGLIFFRMDWLDLAVQRTLKSLLQHHSSKASILQCSAFFIVQLSHPYVATGKTIALTRRTFVDKIMPLLFNMLSTCCQWWTGHSGQT